MNLKRTLSTLIVGVAMMTVVGCTSTSSSVSSSTASSSASSSKPSSSAASSSATSSTTNGTIDKIKSAGKLIMLTNAAFPPFEYVEGDKPVGVDVDIATEIAKDLGVELVVDDIDFNAIIAALSTGKGDIAAAGMTVDEERKKSVDFSVEYITSSQYAITKKGVTVTSMDDLKGKKIGTQLGTTGDLMSDSEIKEGKLKDSGATNTQYKTALEAAMDLKNGKLDVVIIDKHPALAIVANNAELQTSANAIADDEKYAIAVKKGETELLASINKTLERLLKEGKIDEFMLKHTGAK